MYEQQVGEPTRTVHAPPGWYRDPNGGQGFRYWNGSAWAPTPAAGTQTGHDTAQQRVRPMQQAQPRPAAPADGGFFAAVSRRPKVAFWTTLGVALFIGIGVGAASSEQPSDDGGDTSQVADLRDDLDDAKGDLSDTRDRLSATEDNLSAARDDLRAARKKIKKLTAAPTPAVVPSEEAPSGGGETQTFSGNGGKNLGTITVATDSVLEWTNDGDIFQIFDADFGVPVNSTAHSGDTALSAGTYHEFQVNAIGNWTITIRPE